MTFRKSKITGIWSVQFKTKTGMKQISTKQTDLALAKAVAKEAKIKQIELAAQINLIAGAAAMQAIFGRVVDSKQAFKEWYDNLKATHPPGTSERYEKIVSVFLKHQGWGKQLHSIKSTDIDDWVNSSTSGLHAQTRNVHRAALTSFFKFCANEGWCMNPVANVKVKRHLLTHEQNESKERRPFTQEQFEKLIAVAKLEPMPYWYGALMIARYTGLRWGDVSKLETTCIHPDKIIVWTDKRDRRVELPMPPELPPVLDLLAKHPFNQPHASTPPGRVFNEVPVEAWQGGWHGFKRLLGLAGLPLDLSLHCLRHTYATELAKSGMSLKQIARRMGHFGDSSALIYLRSLMDKDD